MPHATQAAPAPYLPGRICPVPPKPHLPHAYQVASAHSRGPRGLAEEEGQLLGGRVGSVRAVACVVGLVGAKLGPDGVWSLQEEQHILSHMSTHVCVFVCT